MFEALASYYSYGVLSLQGILPNGQIYVFSSSKSSFMIRIEYEVICHVTKTVELAYNVTRNFYDLDLQLITLQFHRALKYCLAMNELVVNDY